MLFLFATKNLNVLNIIDDKDKLKKAYKLLNDQNCQELICSKCLCHFWLRTEFYGVGIKLIQHNKIISIYAFVSILIDFGPIETLTIHKGILQVEI